MPVGMAGMGEIWGLKGLGLGLQARAWCEHFFGLDFFFAKKKGRFYAGVQLQAFTLSTPHVTAVPSALIMVTFVCPDAAVKFMTFVLAEPKTVNK